MSEQYNSDKFKVRGVKLSRNFGKEGALFAGLYAVKGDCAAVIDCDLQHPPEIIPKMYKLWSDGYEVVEAVKTSRGNEGTLYKLFAKMFYRLMRGSAEVNLERASDYKLFDRKVLQALLDMPERLTFFRALSSWVGFKSTQVEFNVQPRHAGTTKWNFFKLFKFALNNLTSFTGFPLHIVTFTGIVFLLFGIAVGINTLYNFFTGTAVTGFTTVIILLTLIGSFILLGLGIIGIYIEKIYEEIKFRPRYIISETAEGKIIDVQ
jgi:dolichol-phosphate mannosyltransferase